MLSVFLDEYQRKNLLSICDHWLKRTSPAKIAEMTDAINAALDEWKARRADENGMVEVATGVGLLSVIQPPKKVPASELRPWQCSGPFVNDLLTLCLRLWMTDDPIFLSLANSYDQLTLLSLIGRLSDASTSSDSLFTLSHVLQQALIAESEFWQKTCNQLAPDATSKQRMLSGLNAGGRELAKQRRIAFASNRDKDIRQAAIDWWQWQFRERSSLTNRDLVQFLVDKHPQLLKKSQRSTKLLSKTEIEKKISGTHKEAQYLLARKGS